MNSKEYLEQVKLLDSKIYALLDEKQQLYMMLTKVTTVNNPNKVQTSQDDQFGNTMAKYIDIEDEIDRAVDDLVDTKREIIANVNKYITEPDLITICHKRYFEFKSWEEISIDMGYCYRWVLKLNKQLLHKLDSSLKFI